MIFVVISKTGLEPVVGLVGPELGIEDTVGKGVEDKVVKYVLLVIESEDVYCVGVIAEVFT